MPETLDKCLDLSFLMDNPFIVRISVNEGLDSIEGVMVTF